MNVNKNEISLNKSQNFTLIRKKIILELKQKEIKIKQIKTKQ